MRIFTLSLLIVGASAFIQDRPVSAPSVKGDRTHDGHTSHKDGITLSAYGAVGDGVHDDTKAIQNALAAAALQHVATVQGASGATYLVSKAGTRPVRVPSGALTGLPFCLAIPSGVVLDLQGSTLLLAKGCDAIVATNQGCAIDTDANCGLVNATVDGNYVPFTNHGLVQMVGVHGLRLDVAVKRVVHLGVTLYACSNVSSRYLRADDVVGQPFLIGQPQSTAMAVSGSSFDLISARNVRKEDSASFPGNAFYGELSNCNIGVIQASLCSAGVKFGRTCNDITVKQISIDSIGDSDGNSGVKFQGDLSGGPVRISVGSISATNCSAHGLYMERSSNCTVGAYHGKNNQRLATGPDVWLGGAQDAVNNLVSEAAGGNAVTLRPYASANRLGNVTVINPGSCARDNANRMGISIAGGSGSIAKLLVQDLRGSRVMFRAVDVNSLASRVTVGTMTASGFTGGAINIAAGTSMRADILRTANPTVATVVLKD